MTQLEAARKSMMQIKYWGVRGTIPTPGPETVRYGGNTSCVSVEFGNTVLVLDAGTGARVLGEQLMGRQKNVVFVFSHRHFDHVSGFPYFVPLFDPDQQISVAGILSGDEPPWYPTELLDGQFFPMLVDQMPCNPKCIDAQDYDWVEETGMSVDLFPVVHPGGAVGFRIQAGDSVFVHVPDNELGLDAQTDARVAEICRGANVLSHDAQYLSSDLPLKRGWGHSVMERTCELAARSGVDHVVLFHHDPARTDAELDELNVLLADRHPNLKCTTAYEGLTINL